MRPRKWPSSCWSWAVRKEPTTPPPNASLTFDATALVLLLIVVTAGIGMMRGLRAEGLTLAGVMAAGSVLGNEALRSRLVAVINKLPRLVEYLLAPDGSPLPAGGAPLLGNLDQRLFFAALLFLGGVVLFYLAGSAFGGVAATRLERTLGGLLGGLNGYAMGTTLLSFGQDYMSRHPNSEPWRLQIPASFSPTLPANNVLLSFSPLVFVGVLFLTAVFLVVTWVRR